MWRLKRFKTRDQMVLWLHRHEGLIQWNEVFIQNGYALEYRKLRRVY